jgi:hypothetical protein
MRQIWVTALLLTLSWSTYSQERTPAQEQPSGKSSKPTVNKSQAITKKDPNSQALDLLQSVESDVGRFSPEMRAKLLLQIGKAYAGIDRGRAATALREAFEATFGITDVEHKLERSNLQSEIVRQLGDVQPEAIYALRNSADPRARAFIESRLVQAAMDKGQVRKAALMLGQWDTNLQFPYSIGSPVIHDLPAEDSVDRQAIFSSAITCYERDEQSMPDRIAEFIDATYAKLPPAMVVDGMERALAHVGKLNFNTYRVTVSGPKGVASFTSMYDYLLFQLLPIFDQLDPAKADALRRDHDLVLQLNSRYPKGVQSLQSHDTTSSRSDLTMVYSDPEVADQLAQKARAQQTQTQQVDTIATESVEDFQRAMNVASLLPNSNPEGLIRQDGTPRCEAYNAIAQRMLGRKDFQKAAEATKAMVSAAADLKADLRAQYLLSAILISGGMKDLTSAKQYIASGMKAADDLYQQDAFGDCPNAASKIDWPSTAVWRGLAVPSALISPGEALQLTRSLPDPEIEAAVQVAVASVLLGRHPSYNGAVWKCKDRSESRSFDVPWWETPKTPPSAAPNLEKSERQHQPTDER